MHRALSTLGVVVVFAVTHSTSLAAQSQSSAVVLTAGDSGSHRVRIGGIVGSAVGFTAGVAGSTFMGFDNASGQTRAGLYLGASGAVLGWVVGTVGTLPFHGRNVVGPNDVRNATITGGAVGLTLGVAAGSLMGFKCSGCGATSTAISTIALSGLFGAAVGAVAGHGVGMSLPH